MKRNKNIVITLGLSLSLLLANTPSAHALSSINNIQGTKVEQKSVSTIKQMQVSASTLNIRIGPSTNYSIIGKLTKGTKVNITMPINNGWYKINYNLKVGYVSASGLKEPLNEVVLGIPYISQYPDMPLGCEATSLAQLLNYKGVMVSKRQIANKMPKSPNRNPELGFVGSPFENQKEFSKLYIQRLY